MLNLLYIPLMAALARAAGGGLGAKYLDKFHATWLPELLFAAVIGYANYLMFGLWWLALIGIAVSYAGIQTGHGNVLMSRFGLKHVPKPRLNTLDKIVTVKPTGGVAYSWVFMGVKGCIIGLPVLGLPLAVLWPLSYYIGLRLVPPQWGLHEWLSGASVGLVIALVLGL